MTNDELSQIRSRIALRLSNTVYCTSEYVEELYQEALTHFYRFQRGYPGRIQNDMAYLNKIADNICHTFLRQKNDESLHFIQNYTNEEGNTITIIELIADSDDTPEEAVIRKERATELYRAIDQLPLPLSTIMRLYAEGRSCQEIAEAMRKPLEIIRRNVTRGKKKLKAAMNGYEPG